MRASLKRPVVVLVLAAVAGGAGACKKKTETVEPPTTTVPAAPASTPLAVTSVNLGKSLGPDKRVTAETTTFGTRDTIYASVATDGSGTGGTLAARWTSQDGQVVDETTQSVGAAGPAVTEFHVSKPSGWPVGNYKVEVMLNGAATQSKEFRVQ
jgi:hypothetical protein